MGKFVLTFFIFLWGGGMVEA